MRWSRSTSIAFVTLAACAAEPASVPGDDEVDADPAPDAAAAPRVCTIPASLTTLAAQSAERRERGDGLELYRLLGDFDAYAPKDRLVLELRDGAAPFPGDVAPGVYALTGASLDDCGACVAVLGDFVPVAGALELYLATAGTLTLTSVEPTLEGALEDVSLRQIDGETGAPIEGGCTAAIPSLGFSSPVVTP